MITENDTLPSRPTPLRGRDLSDWTELSDRFHHNPKELNWAFTTHCAVVGHLKLRFPDGFPMPAIVVAEFKPDEIRETVEYAIAHGWLKLPDRNTPVKPEYKRYCTAPGKYTHYYNRLGFCNHCGAPRMRRPRPGSGPAKIIDPNWHRQ